MPNTKQQIIADITDHIQNEYKHWYVGIASDPKSRLFDDHNVSEKNGSWIYKKAENSTMAREIEKYFIEKLGADGGDGGGDYTTKFVYAYRKTSSTKK